MQANQEIFLLVAEEMSISRRLSAPSSRSSVSATISNGWNRIMASGFLQENLVSAYGGRASMLHSLQKIQAIESSLLDSLAKRAGE